MSFRQIECEITTFERTSERDDNKRFPITYFSAKYEFPMVPMEVLRMQSRDYVSIEILKLLNSLQALKLVEKLGYSFQQG